MADIEVAGLVAKISIDDSDLEQSMASLNRQMRVAKSEFAVASSGIKDFGNSVAGLGAQSEGLSKQLQIQGQRVAKLQQEHAKSVREKGADAVATEKLEVKLNKAVAEYNRLHGQLEKVNKEMAVQSSLFTKAGNVLESAGGKMQSIGKGMESAGRSLTKNVTLPLVAAGGLAFKTAMDYESAFAGVRKTVDATEEEFAELSEGIREMSKEIPASATSIAAVAESAGQLGIEVPNIMSFTRTMIDLGEATNMSAEDAATSLARFANITQMSQQDFDKLGSVIVDLGNNLATTEKEIVDMSLRLAGAGKQIGLTEAEIMSFAGGLSSVGIEAQAGGSAFSKVMIEMQLAVETNSKKLKDYAKVAGMSTKDFSKAFKEDAAGALISFIDGLGSAEERGLSTIKVLDDMGITEVRLRDTLLRAAGAGDLFADSIKMGNEAWRENSALAVEAAQRYGTTESQLKILKNRATDVGITLGESLIPAAMGALEAAEPLFKAIENGAKAFANLDTAQQRSILKWAGIALAAGPVLSITGKLTQTIGGVVTGVGKASKWIGSLAKSAKDATSATAGLTQSAGGIASVFSPAGLAIGGVALAIGAITLAYKEYQRPAREAGEAAMSFIDGIREWDAKVDGAVSALAGFNSELIFSSEKMNSLETNIKTTQEKIIGIAELAAQESRAYTEAERKELEELTALLADYTTQKLDALQERSKVTRAMVEAESDMSVDRAAELVKAEKETREMILAEINAEYQDRVALAERKWGHLGTVDKAAYEEELRQATKMRDRRIEIVNSEAAETINAVQERYAEQHKEDMKHIEELGRVAEKIRRLEEEKAKYIETQTAERIAYGQDATTQALENFLIETEAWWKYGREIRKTQKELKKAYDEADEANLDAWLGMLNTVTEYGGRLSFKNEEIVRSIVGSFESLPEEAQKALEAAMEGMYSGMELKTPKILEKASEISRGVLERTHRVFEIHSPSKAMQRIYENLFAGAEIPLRKAEIELPARFGKIAAANLEATSDVPPPLVSERLIEERTITTNKNSRQKVEHSGTITIRGVNDQNELVAVVEARILDTLGMEARLA